MLSKLDQFFEQDANRLQSYQELTARYQRDPTLLSSTEVSQHYGDLASHLDDRDMDAAHEHAFGQLSEQDRRALVQQYQYAHRDPTRSYRGYPDGTDFNQLLRPRQIGRMTRNAAQHDPELLVELVGPESPLNGTSVKLALAAATVALASRYLRTR